jgi:thiamine biosynthesis lipoprotein ApbE
MRGKKLQDSIQAAFEILATHERQYACFSEIQRLERKAAASRLSVARNDMLIAEAKEALLQEKYARFAKKIHIHQSV